MKKGLCRLGMAPVGIREEIVRVCERCVQLQTHGVAVVRVMGPLTTNMELTDKLCDLCSQHHYMADNNKLCDLCSQHHYMADNNKLCDLCSQHPYMNGLANYITIYLPIHT